MQSGQSRAGNGAGTIYGSLHAVSGTQGLSYEQTDGALLRRAITAVVRNGDALLFGATSDGGALSVRVLSKGKTECFYPSDASELQELLEGLIAIAET